MRFRYLGTAAAEGWPALFCQCKACRRAEKRGGKNIRRRSGAMLGKTVLIDLPPDLYAHKLNMGLDLGRVRHIVVTHGHADHFATAELEMFLPVYAHLKERAPLTLYGSEETRRCFERFAAEIDLGGQVAFHTVTPFERFTVDGWGFTAYPAVHGCAGSYIYRVEKDGESLLYGNDSGLLREDVLSALAGLPPLDIVSLDATFGPEENSYTGHMGFARNVQTREEMLRRGIATENTRFILTHFSHNGGMLHKEMAQLMEPQGFEIAYDGMKLED